MGERRAKSGIHMAFIKLRALSSYSMLLLLLLTALYFADSVHVRTIENETRSQVNGKLHEHATRLGNAVHGRISLLYGLRSFVEADPSSPRLAREFDRIGTSMLSTLGGIRSVQLMRRGVVVHEWPIDGNEIVFERELSEPERACFDASIIRAMQTENVVVTGPFRLKQGGLVLIAQLRVKESEKHVWGLAAVVIDLDHLLEECHISAMEEDLHFALRTSDDDVFFGDVDVFAGTPEFHEMVIGDSKWMLAATPVGGWTTLISEKTTTFRIAGLIIALLLTLVLWISMRSRLLLHGMVESRTWELRNLNAELRREVEMRKQTELDLTEALQRAEQADELKDAFIATMSHEIRTPLHVIMGYVGLLCNDNDHNAYERDVYVFSIRQAGKRLMRTVEEVLHMSSLKAGTFKPNECIVDLCQMARDVEMEFSTAAKERGISLGVTVPDERILIRIDRFALEQILCNLVDNAIKYTRQGYVSVKVVDDNNCAVLSVQDTGIGISSDYIARLFDPFTQEITGYNRPYDGLGLGLSLVKRFAEMSNATIGVESRKNEGSLFTVSFPLHAVVPIPRRRVGAPRIAVRKSMHNILS